MRYSRAAGSAGNAVVDDDATTRSAAIRDFLKRELPPARDTEASYLTEAVLAAGHRYDRYAANKKGWWKFAPRRNRLEQTAKLTTALAAAVTNLDILSWDDLGSRVGPKELELFPGSLLRLGKEAADLAKQVQRKGRPRDLAEERWIVELANIYEVAFDAKPRIWGSGSEKGKRRGKFYDFLMVSRPRSYPQHGKLSPRQVHRTLEQKSTHRQLLASLKSP